MCEESASGGDPMCAKPLVLRGTVSRLDSLAALAGADVVALDANGSPSSTVAITDVSGAYQLSIPARRTSDGKPQGAEVTLRADAAGYLTFPSGIRQALPIDTGTPAEERDAFVVMSALTDIGLIALPSAPTGAIAGKVAVPASRTGVLVVAEGNGAACTAIADTEGAYDIVNVPAGSYVVTAYAKGVSYAPGNVTVTAARAAALNLALDTKATATVSGNVQVVNPESGTVTSVILVVESTFNAALARGESPPGLRAPSPGTAPNVSGAFAIAGVPTGRYVVLAAFENDSLVRDPDVSIGNTQILHISVASGVDQSLTSSFKITGALDVLGPGIDVPEAVTAKPQLRWKRDPGAALYEVHVYDALGLEVWTKPSIVPPGSTDLSVAYEGPLVPGMYYQFKALSIKQGGSFISTTEDLRGVFFSQ